ncbi:4-phosphopantetheinyl transferase [Paracoccus sp. M683]|nr:4-phosphopantetheinyl transferase [Paracoccus sp. M683]
MLPADIGCAVVRIGQGGLLPAEEAALGRAVASRRAEFASGRLALRQAIAQLGRALPPDRPILPGPDRRPDLPPDLSVSLSHAGGLCIALASDRPDRHLGVDIEPVDAPTPEGLADSLRPYRMMPQLLDPLIVFCAKEALFKRQFPQTGAMLDFADIALVLGQQGRFAGCVRGAGLMRGKWCRSMGHYLAISLGGGTVRSRGN